MRECQRLLNGETSQTGPLQASFNEVVDVVTLALALPEMTEAGSEAREPDAEANASDNLKAGADGEGEVNDADGKAGVE